MLMVMALASRYPWRLVLLASAVAVSVLMAVAVLFGQVAASILPEWVIGIAAGCLFLGFGIWTLFLGGNLVDREEEPQTPAADRGSLTVLIGLAGAIILAELGDKTQLAVFSLAGLSPEALPEIWAGATAGMLTVLALAIFVGARLTRLLPAGLIQRAAGIVFIAFGVVTLAVALSAI
jgi:putative Ca2+/H+ antiporter (TMEM165/GDT1 family)